MDELTLVFFPLPWVHSLQRLRPSTALHARNESRRVERCAVEVMNVGRCPMSELLFFFVLRAARRETRFGEEVQIH